jgi:hypothetical protein
MSNGPDELALRGRVYETRVYDALDAGAFRGIDGVLVMPDADIVWPITGYHKGYFGPHEGRIKACGIIIISAGDIHAPVLPEFEFGRRAGGKFYFGSRNALNQFVCDGSAQLPAGSGNDNHGGLLINGWLACRDGVHGLENAEEFHEDLSNKTRSAGFLVISSPLFSVCALGNEATQSALLDSRFLVSFKQQKLVFL